jgi:AcrR family transcriptional regulator
MPKRRIAAPVVQRSTNEQETREAIIKTAHDLLRRYGLRKTTMEDIAVAMGKRKSFLYYYFPGKQEVIAAIIENESLEIRQAIRAAVGAKDNPIDRVRAYFFVRSEQIAKRRAEYDDRRFGGMLGEEAVSILQITEDRRRFDEAEVRYLADLMLEGVRAKVFRAMSEKEVLMFCQFALSSLRGAELELLLDTSLAEGLKDRMEVAFNILFKGLVR